MTGAAASPCGVGLNGTYTGLWAGKHVPPATVCFAAILSQNPIPPEIINVGGHGLQMRWINAMTNPTKVIYL